VRDGRLGQLEMGRGHNGHGGAFFVSSGVLFYLYLADVSVPLLGTNFAETPLISAALSSISSSSCSVSILASSGLETAPVPCTPALSPLLAEAPATYTGAATIAPSQ
jgi:hypothetical protein